MSAKKSWDIAPKRTGSTTRSAQSSTRTKRTPAPGARVEMTRRRDHASVRAEAATPTRTRTKPTPRRRRPVERSGALKERRRKARRLTMMVISVLVLITLLGALYMVWLPSLRVQSVEVTGSDPAGMEAVVRDTLVGRQYVLLPRDSIFLLPSPDIRARILAAYPDVQTITISASGFDHLTITTVERTSSFTWCGESAETPAATCYEADADGLLFRELPMRAIPDAMATTSTTTTAAIAPTPVQGSLLVYGALEGVSTTTGTLLRAQVTYASALPGALKFVKAMRSLGADIRSITLRGDEIDLTTRGGTRITYIIGDEGQAAILASTAFPGIEVNDGSIEYVDLRFANKVYVKRKE